ncbi:MAG TPA: hypothetical protein VFT29_05655 [Gemmatimonadaceae bacterium]|nr:hypothetical protein [Gemmatimonadaceae bacterium]
MHIFPAMKALAMAVRVSLVISAIVSAVATPASAQKRTQEFVRQFVLVSNFSAPLTDTRADLKLGRSVGDAVRDRLDDLVNKRETRVVSGRDLRERLLRSSYPPDAAFTLPELKIIGEFFRVDELIVGTATRARTGVTIDASLLLWRDTRLRQPIERVSEPDFNKAIAYDSLGRRPQAADMWLGFVATDSTSLELVERVLWSMAEGGNSRRAEPLRIRMSDRHPDGQPFKAVELVSRGVATFPRDPRLYAIATIALSKGNAFFRAANGTRLRADFQLATRYLAFADTLESTLQTKFLLGAAALSVAQTALTEAPTITVKEDGCRVSQLGAESIPVARASLEAGREVSPDAVKEFLDYLDVIRPYAQKQINAFCTSPAAPNAPNSPTSRTSPASPASPASPTSGPKERPPVGKS